MLIFYFLFCLVFVTSSFVNAVLMRNLNAIFSPFDETSSWTHFCWEDKGNNEENSQFRLNGKLTLGKLRLISTWFHSGAMASDQRSTMGKKIWLSTVYNWTSSQRSVGTVESCRCGEVLNKSRVWFFVRKSEKSGRRRAVVVVERWPLAEVRLYIQ